MLKLRCHLRSLFEGVIFKNTVKMRVFEGSEDENVVKMQVFRLGQPPTTFFERGVGVLGRGKGRGKPLPSN